MLLTFVAPLMLSAAPVDSAVSQLTVQSCQFGETFVFSPAECTIEVKNAGGKKVKVVRVLPSNPADMIDPPSFSLEPGGTAKLKVKVQPDTAVGLTSRMFLLDTGETKQVPTYAYAQGFVASVLDDPRPSVNFGDVVLGGPLPAREVMLSSREVGDLRVTGIVESPEFIEATIGKDGRTVRVAYKASAPWGARSADRIVVALNSPQQTKTAMTISANIIGAITPEKDPFDLGVVRTDADRDYFVPLRNTSGKPFRGGSVKLEGLKGGKADLVDCAPAQAGCKRIRIHGGKGAGFGPLEAMATVELPEHKQHLPIRLMATALPPGVDPAPEPEETLTDEQKRLMADPKARGANDIREILKAKVRETNTPSPAGRGPLLKWSVANEEAVYGYVIFRGDSEAGPFVRISKETIPAGTFEAGYANAYQWRDTSAVVGQTYWYSIGLINKDGTKDSLTGPQRVVAK